VLCREISLSDDEQADQLTVAGSSPSSQAMAQEQAEGVQQALSLLPDEYRQVIVWRHHDHCSFEEIGERLDRTAGAARKLWVRAIERLQKEVKRPS
jgi:RNA polymerase sigma-70 factor (ECF subfamily)